MSEAGTGPEAERSEAQQFRLDFCFDGTAYQGWQSQPHGLTVQDILQQRMSTLFGGVPIRLQGSSRTDSGVHALHFVASFLAPPSPYIPDWKIKKALNRLLPPDIRILEAAPAAADFNARFSALGKAYTYVINTGTESPFAGRWSWQLTQCAELDAMREALRQLEGTRDFSSFTVDRKEIGSAVRTIHRASLDQFGPFLCLSFIGDGFLYKMVRGMAATIAAVGLGRKSPSEIPLILAAQDRCKAEPTAPAQGLFLMKVFYEGDSWQDFKLEKLPFYH
ncbi:MAG: tRNA pseudouridine(38-40) synthase TruA [Lentisphaerae bacterium GWF2_52_8]|nr:MAG: tRNA pseudouridine(38-40) synthase TruA [Lentisphaerae bacterium GWF2_52_8]